MTTTTGFAAQTLRPGLLVHVKTSIFGNVSYVKKDLETNHKTEGGATRARWETEREITDAAEYEAATAVRSKARSLIAAVCTKSSAFGLLCPETSAEDLRQAVDAARTLADEFNANAKVTSVRFFVLAGKIASDDLEAVKAVNGEVRELLSDMKEGLENLDVARVRDAAARAKDLGKMLTPDAQARIQIAVDAARSVATKIVKAGETAAAVIDRATIQTLTEVRGAFLDLDDAREVAAPKVTGRAVDLEPEPELDEEARAVEAEAQTAAEADAVARFYDEENVS